MSYQDFRILLSVAAQHTDYDEFTSEAERVYSAITKGQTLYIWGVARRPTVDAVRSFAGLSRAAFSRSYGIPIRSLEAWSTGDRTPPDYTISLLAYAVMFSAPLDA